LPIDFLHGFRIVRRVLAPWVIYKVFANAEVRKLNKKKRSAERQRKRYKEGQSRKEEALRQQPEKEEVQSLPLT
jgi:hypothetical protein